MQITGGLVAFEDGTKKAEEYTPPRKARVELRFDVAEGGDADAALEYVSKTAMARVYSMLSQTPAETVEPAKRRGRPPADKTVAQQHEATVAAAAQSSKATAAVINDKEKLAAQAGLTQQQAAQAASDPAAMDEFAVTPNDPAAVETIVQPEPVSDAELNKAVQTKNAEIKDPVAIRAVIAKFNPDPSKQFTMAQIPQDQRRTFLAKIGELKGKA